MKFQCPSQFKWFKVQYHTKILFLLILFCYEEFALAKKLATSLKSAPAHHHKPWKALLRRHGAPQLDTSVLHWLVSPLIMF